MFHHQQLDNNNNNNNNRRAVGLQRNPNAATMEQSTDRKNDYNISQLVA